MVATQARFLKCVFLLSAVVSVLYTTFFHYRYQHYSTSLENDDSLDSFFQYVDEEEMDQRKRAAILALQQRNDTSTQALINPLTSPPTQPQIIRHTQTSAFRRFDQASPKIRKAKTHFLQSIPLKHRLPMLLDLNVTEYAANPTHRYPHKLHLYEVNPCIAVLPMKYRDVFGIGETQPLYITVYRVTHKNNCYDGHDNIELLGGTWDPTISDYVGVALLDKDLNIMHETVVTLLEPSPVSSLLPYNDYRIYNLHGDQLYLTTINKIVPMHLRLTENVDNPMERDSLLQLQPAFPTLQQPFQVLIRNYTACAVYHSNDFKRRGDSKNLLYFVSHDQRGNSSAASANTNDNTWVIHYPRYNPNDVRKVELDTPCGVQPITPYKDTHGTEWYPNASFHTIDEEMFPQSSLKVPIWLRDRGSACCTEMIHRTTNRAVLVAVVHPKTVFPGKTLPPGVTPNTYLSRWIAFEPTHPYKIVARSGMFCLGYPDEMDGLVNVTDSNSSLYQNPLATTQMIPLRFAGVSHSCPRIHFVMGMVEKVDDKDSVLISYGVSDCLSRIVEIRKDDIHAVLWPTTTL
jgi:hypothetical protein